jgi:transcriptional regulator with XRE-family HTH domain
MATAPKKRKVKREKKTYTSYFFTGNDPILSWFNREKKSIGVTDAEISKESGVSRSTLRNYDTLKTKYPKHETIAASCAAIGADYLPITEKARRDYKLK